MLSRASALVLFFLLSVASAIAQSDRGSLTGRVTDPTGAGVPSAKVTATNLNSNETREVQTSGEGNYTIPELKADPYKVTVEAPGFKTASAENIVVAVQVNRTVDFKLEIGEISSVVTISNDEAPVLQTETPVRQTNVSERQVKELPLLVSSEFAGRTPLSFIYLDSNVTQGGDIQGNGARGTDTGGGGQVFSPSRTTVIERWTTSSKCGVLRSSRAASTGSRPRSRTSVAVTSRRSKRSRR